MAIGKTIAKACWSAAVLGAAFLAIYLTYHFSAGLAKFGGHGTIRPIYFTLLGGPRPDGARRRAARAGDAGARPRRKHHAPTARVASWALPIWLFVSVSGVVVYVMAIHIYPYTGA